MYIFTPNTLIKSTEVNANFDELLTKTDYLTAPDSGWIAPTFTNSWVNYGFGFNSAGYRKDALGYVHLRGLVKNGTVNTAIFNLPAGYRPEAQELFMSMQNNTIGRIDVNIVGNVLHSVGANTFVQLDGITFKAFQ